MNGVRALIEKEKNSIKVFMLFWRARKKIFTITLILTLIGAFVTIFSEKEYKSSMIFVPQGADKESGVSGGLSNLAAIAGVNIGGGAKGSGISVALYSDILNSIPYQKELMNTKLTIKGQPNKVTFKEYYENIYSPDILSKIKKYTIGLPGTIIGAIRGGGKGEGEVSLYKNSDSIIYINNSEKRLIDRLSKQISLSIDKKKRSVTISAMMPEAIAAAELTYEAEKLLEKYIISYKVKKSKEKLNFIENRLAEKEKEFKQKQFQLANYQDKNRFASTLTSQTRLLSLQSQYNLAMSVYSDLAQQVEAQKIQVKEDMPIFTIIKPVSIPTQKSNSGFGKVFYIWAVSGFILGILYIFGKQVVLDFKKEFNSNEK